MNKNDLLIGLMLGDGSLEKRANYKNAVLRITRKLDDKGYLLWSAGILKEYISEKGITEKKFFDKRTNNLYYSVRLRSRANKIFTDLYDLWYPEGKKIVWKGLKLNYNIVKVWMADDGYVKINKGEYGKCNFDIKFATHSFDKEDVVFLKAKLEELFGYEFKIYEEKSKNGKNQCTIRLFGVAKCKDFLRKIDTDFPLHRKCELWRDPECKTFEDIKYPNCKYCDSSLVYKFGSARGEPKFLCRSCGRQFTERTTGERKENKNTTKALVGEYWKDKK